MTHSDQSAENEISGDVLGTSLQATSMRDVYMGGPAKPRWLKALQYLAAPVGAVAGVSAVALVTLWPPDEQAKQTPAAVTSPVPEETTTASSSSSAPRAPVTSAVAVVVRPTLSSPTSRSSAGAPLPVPTTTIAVTPAAAPPPVATGVRYSGALQFGSLHLDLPQPRDVPGVNVWPLTPGRLHGDDGYWLAEWVGDGVPGQSECDSDIARRGTRDAANLIAGSRVCGRTPGGRVFLVEVTAVDSTTISGQVTVWE